MTRSSNAQIAVELFEELRTQHFWTKKTAWHGIAQLLLSCQIQPSAAIGWLDFHDVIVFRESNDFPKKGEFNMVLERAESLTGYVASSLGVSRADLCGQIGTYWRHPKISNLQHHNLVGHAFRSLLVQILEIFGDTGIEYDEEVDPHDEFPGYQFQTRSKRPKIDIVARRSGRTVALISSKWRYRHDRTEFVDEALAYAGPARRSNASCRLYAWVGEFSPARLEKALDHCPPKHPNPVLSATVHFHAPLITRGLSENGRMNDLQGLTWLIDETHKWE